MRHWESWDALIFLNQSKTHNLGVKCRRFFIIIVTTRYSKARVWWWLWRMSSNLNLLQPFIILIIRYWKGWDAVNCPNQSKLTQSWCQKWKTGKPTLTPPVTEKHVMVTTLEPTHQSQPSPSIHYTYWEVKRVHMLWYSSINPKHTQYWCEMYRVLALVKLVPPMTQKPGCGDGYTRWTEIWTLSNHSLYL